MTLLVDRDIKALINEDRLGKGPFDLDLVSPSTLDFRLGKTYTQVMATSYNRFKINVIGDALDPTLPMYGTIDPTNKATFEDSTFEADEYWLLPGENILVSMYEHLALPGNITAEIKGKSSLARLGLQNSSEGGLIDPGWRGYITLELTNHSNKAILLSYMMKIGQLLFHKHEHVAKSYQETGRYLDQAPGAGSLGV